MRWSSKDTPTYNKERADLSYMPQIVLAIGLGLEDAST